MKTSSSSPAGAANKMATMKEIAHLAGVSVGTVSNVLNGFSTVREPLRQRVLAVVDQIGYQPNPLSRALRRDHADILAMLIPDISYGPVSEIARGAEDAAFSHGYRLMLANTSNDPVREAAQLRQIRGYIPAGLMLLPAIGQGGTTALEDELRTYRKYGASVVAITRVPPDWSGDTVLAANAAGGKIAVEQLIRLGHARIALLSGPTSDSATVERIQGFRTALDSAGIDLMQHVETTSSRSAARQAAEAFFNGTRHSRPTAIFATDESLALGALEAAQEIGIRCPDDLSVIGFGDSERGRSAQLATISYSSYEIGVAAARILVERAFGIRSAARHRTVNTRLDPRGNYTLGPAPRMA